MRDAQMPGENITVYDQLPVFGGSMNAAGSAAGGYVSRGERELEPYMECLWYLCSKIPSLDDPTRTVLDETVDVNRELPIHSECRAIQNCGHIWEGILHTKRNEYDSISKPGTGGCITVKDSGWEMSLMLYDRDYFPNQRANNEDCLWGDGLFGERCGNYIKKPMAECTGEEILTGILYHFNLLDMKDEVLFHAYVSTCMMPYITSQFMPVPAPTVPRWCRMAAPTWRSSASSWKFRATWYSPWRPPSVLPWRPCISSQDLTRRSSRWIRRSMTCATSSSRS